MTTLFKGGVSDWIRGSQSVLHEWRMLFQSMWQTIAAGFVILCCAVVIGGYLNLSDQQRHVMAVYTKAIANKMILSDPTKEVIYTDEDGTQWAVTSAKFLQSQLVDDAIRAVLLGAAHGFRYGFGIFLVIIILLGGYFYMRGREQSREAYIRGARIGTTQELAKALTRHGKPGVLELGEVHLPRLHKILRPAIILALGNAFPEAQLGNRMLAAHAFQNNADLLFSGIFASGATLHRLYVLLGTFGFSAHLHSLSQLR